MRTQVPGLTTFDGDPLLYPGWKHAFNVLIDGSGITPMDRFLYLEKYLKGQPLELVKEYALIDNETAFHDARKALEERYRNSFVIAKAYQDKIERWPRIATKDAPGLRKFSFSHHRQVKEEIAPNQVVKLLEADFMQGKESKPYSQNDVKFLKLMKEGIHVTESGQYEMSLPFSDENLSLPNNRFPTEKRLDQLKKRLQRDPEYHTLYNQKMTFLFDNNYAEIVTDQGEGRAWYIPHQR